MKRRVVIDPTASVQPEWTIHPGWSSLLTVEEQGCANADVHAFRMGAIVRELWRMDSGATRAIRGLPRNDLILGSPGGPTVPATILRRARAVYRLRKARGCDHRRSGKT